MKKMEIKPRKAPPQPGSARKWWTIAGLVMLVCGGISMAAYWRYTHPPEDPQVTKVKALQQQMFASFDAERSTSTPSTSTTPVSATPVKPLTAQERSAAREQLRAEMDKLTEEQQEQVRREAGNAFRDRMHATMKEYRALPKEKRTAFLDKQIDDMERRNGQFQRDRQRNGNRAPGGQGGAAGGTQPTSTGGAAASSASTSGGNGPPRDGERRGPPSTERRLEWRRQMLANSTPLERAEADLFFSDLNARREARGLEPFGPGRPR